MQDKINSILAQESLNEADVKLVMANLSLVSEAGKARLGLIPVIEMKPAKEPTLEVETPKRKVNKK